MIIKQRNYKLPSGTLYGFAGAAFGIVTVGLMVQSHFAPDTYPGCAERYGQAGMFALERSSGARLEPSELQSKLAGREWGVLHNIAIRPDETAAGKTAMTVTFKAGGEIEPAKRRAASGVGFQWQPGYLLGANAACLSYSVKLPAKFEPANGGTLPGLFGARSKHTEPDFSLRMRWLADARLGIQPVNSRSKEKSRAIAIAGQRLKLPRDRWFEIEQEVILNTPGKSDGIVRVWVDGNIWLTLEGQTFRKDANSGFRGVIADTHYANGDMQWAPAPTATEIKLTPLLVRWN